MGRGTELKAPSNTVVEEEQGGGQTPPSETPHALEARALTQKLITQFTGYKAKGEMARCKDCAALLPEGEVHTCQWLPWVILQIVEYSRWWSNTVPPIQKWY